MLEAARKVVRYTAGCEMATFPGQELIYDATLRNLERAEAGGAVEVGRGGEGGRPGGVFGLASARAVDAVEVGAPDRRQVVNGPVERDEDAAPGNGKGGPPVLGVRGAAG